MLRRDDFSPIPHFAQFFCLGLPSSQLPHVRSVKKRQGTDGRSVIAALFIADRVTAFFVSRTLRPPVY